jgi:hypothetical protein
MAFIKIYSKKGKLLSHFEAATEAGLARKIEKAHAAAVRRSK